ncbi:MAG: 4Fe-4S dicluster domain-containing protein [Planctomycetes bacterium]|nr:4Fe-4S dicluster domain-containing protein [Planctomycetota bacterium]
MSQGNISYQPTAGLSYDPSEARYWDPQALDQEVERVFEVCHGCRMCFKFCDSFPILFEAVDERHDGDVRKVTVAETARVMDACFQCKLCEVQCPYTPRDGHEFQLDFPKLVHRYKAQRHRREGGSLRDKVLADPDGAGRMARASFGLANAMNRVGLHRWFLEKVLGIHREKLLPDFAGTTFERWAEREGKVGAPGGEAVLFQTCYVQNNEPEIGRDTVAVFEKNGVDLRCTKGLGCCGMPAWESGDLETTRERARHNLDVLMPWVEAGAKVVAINPTCSMMMRREYPELLEGADRERAERLAAAVMDPSEFLWSIRNEERFCTDFKSTPGEKVAYHAPCHLRAQAIGFKGRDLLRKIPGVKPALVSECCGHDGTYAMKVEGFEPSQRAGKRAFEGVADADAEVWSTDCPLAALQFQQHAGKKPMHPMTILARAYRADGFPTALPAGGDEA